MKTELCFVTQEQLTNLLSRSQYKSQIGILKGLKNDIQYRKNVLRGNMSEEPIILALVLYGIDEAVKIIDHYIGTLEFISKSLERSEIQ